MKSNTKLTKKLTHISHVKGQVIRLVRLCMMLTHAKMRWILIAQATAQLLDKRTVKYVYLNSNSIVSHNLETS